MKKGIVPEKNTFPLSYPSLNQDRRVIKARTSTPFKDRRENSETLFIS